MEVAAEDFAIMQIDVEHREVEKGELQVFGRWKIAVGSQRLRVGFFQHLDQIAQETLNAALAVPAYNSGGNLVADAVGQNAREHLPGGDCRAHRVPGFALRLPAVEKAHVFGPRDVDEDADPALLGQFE